MNVRYPVSIPVTAYDKMSGPFRHMSASVQKLQMQVKRVNDLAGVAASGLLVQKFREIGRSAVELANTGDKIAKTADKLGLGIEAYQELTFAADRSGVSSSTLESSMTALTKRVGELKGGSGALAGYLKRTNPALLEQVKNTKDSGEAFNLLVDEMSRMSDPSKKAAFAAAAFSRAGIGIVNMTKDGVPGLNALREEARELGEVMSERTARASEVMVDAMRNMEATTKGIGNALGAVFIPMLTSVLQSITPVTRAIGKFFSDSEHGALRAKFALGILTPILGTLMVAAVITLGASVYGTLLPALQLMWSLVTLAGSGVTWLTTALSANSIANLKNAAAQKAAMLSRKMSVALMGIERAGMTLSTVLYGVATGKIGLATAAQWAWNTALAANPIGLIVAGIALLVGVIGALVLDVDDVKAAFVSLGQYAVQVWNWIAAIPGKIMAWWGRLPGWVQNFGVAFAPFLLIPRLIATHWRAVLMVPDLVVGMWNRLLTYGVQVRDSLRATVVSAAEWIAEKWAYVTGLPGRIVRAWGSLPGWAQGLLALLAPFIALPLAIADNWQWLTTKLQEAVGAFRSLGSLVGLGGGEGSPAAAGTAGGGGARGRPLPTGAGNAPNVFAAARTERSEVKVTFDRLPAGATVAQDRPAKNAEIEYTGLALDGAL